MITTGPPEPISGQHSVPLYRSSTSSEGREGRRRGERRRVDGERKKKGGEEKKCNSHLARNP